ncbi:helix-turn-helix domain-containing protein [Rothia nasimurium]|nr:helix-turn-helix domain-containing protein [Rothia nasimurium]
MCAVNWGRPSYNNKAKAIRFTTLTAICKALDCEIGKLLTLK